MAIVNKPTVIEGAGCRFYIMDAPNDQNLHLYVKELKDENIHDVVRACESTYDKGGFEKAGIRVHDLEFPDGSPPDTSVIRRWMDLCDEVFRAKKSSAPSRDGKLPGIAVHCIAGLGRAPVLVAIALIENGMDAIEAVEFIRQRRRGAINMRQLTYLEKYQRTRSNREKCCVM